MSFWEPFFATESVALRNRCTDPNSSRRDSCGEKGSKGKHWGDEGGVSW